MPRALEEAGAKAGDSITPRRVASKPVTVEQLQEQPDRTKQLVRVDTKRNSWQVENHGIDREAVIKGYDSLVKTPDDRKELERAAPLLVAARDTSVVELKREKIATELARRKSQKHIVRSRKFCNTMRSFPQIRQVAAAITNSPRMVAVLAAAGISPSALMRPCY